MVQIVKATMIFVFIFLGDMSFALFCINKYSPEIFSQVHNMPCDFICICRPKRTLCLNYLHIIDMWFWYYATKISISSLGPFKQSACSPRDIPCVRRHLGALLSRKQVLLWTTFIWCGRVSFRKIKKFVCDGHSVMEPYTIYKAVSF